jgi:hypothetical protein
VRQCAVVGSDGGEPQTSGHIQSARLETAHTKTRVVAACLALFGDSAHEGVHISIGRHIKKITAKDYHNRNSL